jgi:hypothetical protein
VQDGQRKQRGGEDFDAVIHAWALFVSAYDRPALCGEVPLA